jgi:hypothetical protein
MKNILELVERELEKRQQRAKDFYHDFCRLERENKKLQKENEILRNDLFELSQQYIKNDNNKKTKN